MVQPLPMNYGQTIIAEINATVLQRSSVQPINCVKSLFQILQHAVQLFSMHSPHHFIILFDKEMSLPLFVTMLHAYSSFAVLISLEMKAGLLNLIQLTPDVVVPLYIIYYYCQVDLANVSDIVTVWI